MQSITFSTPIGGDEEIGHKIASVLTAADGSTITPTSVQTVNGLPAALIRPTGTLEEQIGISGPFRIGTLDQRFRAERALHFKPPMRSVADLHNRYLGQTVCIVGGGTSIDDTFPELLAMVAAGAKIIAVNKTHDWLIDKGLIPTFGAMTDPKDFVADYQTPHPDVIYLLGSTLHDKTFARFIGHPGAYLWHPLQQKDDRDWLWKLGERERQSVVGFEGTNTMGLRSIEASSFLGFRDLHLFGMDSSAGPLGDLHAYDKPLKDPVALELYLTDPLTGTGLPQMYRTSRPMAHQAMQFELLMRTRAEQIRNDSYPPINITVHGKGLLPAWAALRGMHADPTYADQLRAAVSRSTYDPNDNPDEEEGKCQTPQPISSEPLQKLGKSGETSAT